MSLKARLDKLQDRLHGGQEHIVISMVLHLPPGAKDNAPPTMQRVAPGILVWFVHLPGDFSAADRERAEQRELRRLRKVCAAIPTPPAPIAALPALPRDDDYDNEE